jgi:hypothetical protein
MKLSDILNAYAVPLEVDDLAFAITPFPNSRIAQWNRIVNPDLPKDATNAELLDISEGVQKAQLKLLAEHLRGCVTSGDAKLVTPKWVSDTLPQPVLNELATFLVGGDKPSWVGESGN